MRLTTQSQIYGGKQGLRFSPEFIVQEYSIVQTGDHKDVVTVSKVCTEGDFVVKTNGKSVKVVEKITVASIKKCTGTYVPK
jgi:hypothetical protein